jgi:hypothetical protein
MGKQRPWLAGFMAAVWVYAQYRVRVRPWIYTWGAQRGEIAAVLPGDELVAEGVPRTTRAMSVDAPVETTWKWLAQIGEDRGGFYSYSWLERAVGARIHNARSLQPAWQKLRVGDTIWLARRYGDIGHLVVAAIKPNSYLVLLSVDDFARVERGKKALGAWCFYLQRVDGWTRLVARTSGGMVGHIAFDIPHFVMEQKMLSGIRRRAEQTLPDEIEATSHRQTVRGPVA